ncbi:hypothetical protein B0H66DRAFT_586547 [Apodospora peruviana]|uniref:PhoD-like phosphatase domain-containing protein n=1 Tax=Apodospora peruviana TaxID=516989 RepID=A0AAE0MFA8_9PEZI|nr:hypothetical protein B0H66DRAFT_586547 [Apodospora peruviana]
MSGRRSSSSSSDDEHAHVPEGSRKSSNPYSSSTRWRHQESSAYARHARQQQQQQPHLGGTGVAREADSRGRVNDLADFLNTSRISAPDDASGGRPTTPRYKPIVAGAAEAREGGAGFDTAHYDGKLVTSGPLLNYRRMEGTRWIGSVLVVTKGGGREQPHKPTLRLRKAAATSSGNESDETEIEPTCLFSDTRNTFWRFDLAVKMDHSAETKWEYELPGLRFESETKPRTNSFFVPAATESMRIMFHSCNGFSVGTDEDAWSGPCLWNDVMRRHKEVPFHVMIGGGDQIYNDGIRVHGPLREWTGVQNPKKRRQYKFPETLRHDCDEYYLKNYIKWYNTEPFAAANGQIAQLNIWDDHDIIDGFGSYVNDFMNCEVFRGIGGVAHKYYMLFQHHLPPPASTFSSDTVPATSAEKGQGVDPNQMVNTYVHPPIVESNYIIGSQPGPYVSEHSHNMFAKLGARMAFLGIDARTERTRHQVNFPETYDQIFARLKEELSAAKSSGNPFRHLILLLGVPIAYPRLTWLENIFASPILGPIKFLNRRVGLGGSFFNSFDGSVDLLDDLDDHYTARTHKKERNHLIERLQVICAEFSVRITILSGDVHLAALGRFYSNPKLNIPTEHDYRYIANVVSSAIVNKPPPAAVANLLSRRNKIHHLNHDTDETLLKMFDKDPGDSNKTANHNQVTMPSRNFAIITENSPNNAPSGGGHNGEQSEFLSPPQAPFRSNENYAGSEHSGSGGGGPPGSSAGHSVRSNHHGPHHHVKASSGKPTSAWPSKDPRYAIGSGEVNAGTQHKAASPTEHGKGSDGSLDVCIRVEIDQHDPTGRTEPYGLSIPVLDYSGPKPPSVKAPQVRHSGDDGRTSVGSRSSSAASDQEHRQQEHQQQHQQ